MKYSFPYFNTGQDTLCYIRGTSRTFGFPLDLWKILKVHNTEMNARV